MKLTKARLKQIIKEEVNNAVRVTRESAPPSPAGNKPYVLLYDPDGSYGHFEKRLGRFTSRQKAEKAREKHLRYNTAEEDYADDEEYEEVLQRDREENYRIGLESDFFHV
jgi:hypothetical protein